MILILSILVLAMIIYYCLMGRQEFNKIDLKTDYYPKYGGPGRFGAVKPNYCFVCNSNGILKYTFVSQLDFERFKEGDVVKSNWKNIFPKGNVTKEIKDSAIVEKKFGDSYYLIAEDRTYVKISKFADWYWRSYCNVSGNSYLKTSWHN